MTEVLLARVPSPVGPVHLAASPAGLLAIQLPAPDQDGAEILRVKVGELVPDAELRAGRLAEASRQLGEYFAARRRRFALPLDLRARGFTRRVLQALREIPWGQTRSYGQIAERIGSPGAARAVGSACGSNPLPLVIPCHRVVAARGLGGFGGGARGLALKAALLALEGALPAAERPPRLPGWA